MTPIPIERGRLITLPPGVRIAIIDPNAYWRRPYYWATLGEDFSELNALLMRLRDVEPVEVSWPESAPLFSWLSWLRRLRP